MENQKFLDKAPKLVIDKERGKLMKLNEALRKTEEQLKNVQERKLEK